MKSCQPSLSNTGYCEDVSMNITQDDGGGGPGGGGGGGGGGAPISGGGAWKNTLT